MTTELHAVAFELFLLNSTFRTFRTLHSQV
jgi:hypothetical protein